MGYRQFVDITAALIEPVMSTVATCLQYECRLAARRRCLNFNPQG